MRVCAAAPRYLVKFRRSLARHRYALMIDMFLRRPVSLSRLPIAAIYLRASLSVAAPVPACGHLLAQLRANID